jgi:hypothetical protein
MITYRVIVLSVMSLVAMGQIAKANGTTQTWGYVECSLGGDRIGRRKIIESLTSFDLGEALKKKGRRYVYEFLPEVSDNAPSTVMWLWYMLPDRMELAYGPGDRLQSIDYWVHDGSRRYPLGDRTTSLGREYMDSSLLLCLFALGQISQTNVLTSTGMLTVADEKSIEALEQCTITMQRVSRSGVNTVLHKYTGLQTIQNICKDNRNLGFKETSLATGPARTRESISFLDIPDVPIKGGIGGRRQRLWLSSAGDAVGTSLIMDLSGQTPDFGRELDAFWSGHYVQFNPVAAEAVTNTLFSHLRPDTVTPSQDKVQLTPQEIEKRMYSTPWRWEVQWIVGRETLNGILKDDVGQPRWESPRYSELRRELNFEWSSNASNKMSSSNLLLVPSRIVLKRVDGNKKLGGIDIYVKGTIKDKEYGKQVLRASIGLLIATGYLELSAGEGYYDAVSGSSAELDQRVNLAECKISLMIDTGNPVTPMEVFSVPSDFAAISVVRWRRDYFSERGYRYCFVGRELNTSEARAYISIRREGDFGGGRFSLKPGFHWMPYAEVAVGEIAMGVERSGVLKGETIRVSMSRKQPVPGELCHLLDAHFRGLTISTNQLVCQRAPISVEMMTKLTDAEREAVELMLRLLNSAKAQYEINHKGDSNSITWKDLEEYLEIELGEIETPHGGAYSIGVIGDDVCYGYPDGTPITAALLPPQSGLKRAVKNSTNENSRQFTPKKP